MTDHARCDDTDHNFAKFDDATIYCRRCGDQRVVDVKALMAMLPPVQYIYPVCPGPHWYPTYPTYPLGWGTTTVGSGITIGSTATYDDSNVTYTVRS